MKEQEIYQGFNSKEQADYEQYLINRFGEHAKKTIKESRENLKSWTKQDFEKSGREFDEICHDLAGLRAKHFKPASAEVQKVIYRHYQWLKHYWTPEKESYTALGQLYTEFKWKQKFESYDTEHPKLAQFFAEGMRIFAETL